MKTINEINEAINSYEGLLTLTKKTIDVLEYHDKDLYGTNDQIERIDFDSPEEVCVKYNGGDRYDIDYDYFSFPLEWLTKTDEELKEIVITQKKLRLEEERKKNKERLSDYNKIVEQREREIYNKLKVKYG